MKEAPLSDRLAVLPQYLLPKQALTSTAGRFARARAGRWTSVQHELPVDVPPFVRRDQAAVAYAATVRAHPDFADAWNNLAQVRLELGQLPQAREAVRRAVALGGPRQADYLKLQATIDARRQP